jgi:hypothetical protein
MSDEEYNSDVGSDNDASAQPAQNTLGESQAAAVQQKMSLDQLSREHFEKVKGVKKRRVEGAASEDTNCLLCLLSRMIRLLCFPSHFLCFLPGFIDNFLWASNGSGQKEGSSFRPPVKKKALCLFLTKILSKVVLVSHFTSNCPLFVEQRIIELIIELIELL